MALDPVPSWLLLIITLPTPSATARMRVWRALKALGCMALRDGAYLLPHGDGREEALLEMADEALREGGHAWLLQVQAATPAEQAALATLYVVLMTDHCLDALGAQGRVVVEGAFTANSWFGPLLAGLADGRDVTVSDDSSGTTCGAWLLDAWGSRPEGAAQPVAALNPPGWRAYRDAWRTHVGAH